LLAPKRIIYCEGKDKPSGDGSEKGFDAQVFLMLFLVTNFPILYLYLRVAIPS
jgi:hypothetical protein